MGEKTVKINQPILFTFHVGLKSAQLRNKIYLWWLNSLLKLKTVMSIMVARLPRTSGGWSLLVGLPMRGKLADLASFKREID